MSSIHGEHDSRLARFTVIEIRGECDSRLARFAVSAIHRARDLRFEILVSNHAEIHSFAKIDNGKPNLENTGGDRHSSRVFKINVLKITFIQGIKCQKMTLVLT